MLEKYCGYCMEPTTPGQKCPRCGRENDYEAPLHHIKCGSALREGKYLIGKAIGEGGFGITYVGTDLLLERRIAVKEYFPHGYSNRNNAESNKVTFSQGEHTESYKKNMDRILAEARVLARFDNVQGVVNVRDFFKENGTAYIVMEYLDGITLRDYVKRKNKIPPDKLLKMILPILDTLSQIHKAGVIHRDISPDNIMLLRSGGLKLLDFGAARRVSEDKSMSIMLKRGYTPFEQYSSKGELGPWTDVYAMCATIYKCITGKTPEEALARINGEDGLKPPSELGIDLPPHYERAIMWGMRIMPQDRIQNMEELSRLLQGKDQCTACEPGITVEEPATEKPVPVPSEPNVPNDPSAPAEPGVRLRGNGFFQPGGDLEGPPAKKRSNEEGTPQEVERGPYWAPGGDLSQKGGEKQPEPFSGGNQPEVGVSTPEKEQPGRDVTWNSPPGGSTGPTSWTPEQQEPDKPEGKKAGIIVGAFLAVALLIVAIILCGQLGLFGKDMASSLPDKRTLNSDCKTVLRENGVSGTLLLIEFTDKNYNENKATYAVTCAVTMRESDGREYTVSVDLRYNYTNGEWLLSAESSLD